MDLSCLRVPLAIGLLAGAAMLARPSSCLAADSLSSVQQAAAEWAKLRAETVHLETEWRMQREMLQASLDGLQSRIADLEANRDALQAELDEEKARSADVVAKTAEFRTALATIEQRLQGLTASLAALRPWLPPRLSTGLDLAFRSISDEKLGPAERMQHVVTIFNRCSAFNKVMTFVEEPLALDGSGEERLLEVLYVGLSHAYALDRAHDIAYLGRPGTEGWTWEKRDNLADPVADLIAIHEERSDPEFIALAAQISDPAALSTTAAQP